MTKRSSNSHKHGRTAVIVFAVAMLFIVAFWLWPPARQAASTVIDDSGEPAVRIADTDYPETTDEIPDAASEAAIVDLCAATESVDTPEAHVLSADEFKTAVAEYEEFVRTTTERLADSPDAGHLHAMALLEKDPARRMDLLTRAMAVGDDDAFLVWDAVRICAASLDQTDCPLQIWEDKLLLLDGQNSETWVRVASNRRMAGDDTAALHAMRQAASAPVTNTYWTESVEMMERALAATGDYTFTERTVYAFGATSSNLHVMTIYRMCREQTARGIDWAFSCLDYGELAERQGKTIMGQAIARVIQMESLKALGDEQQLAVVTARHETARQSRDRLISDSRQIRLRESVMMANPALFSSYLAVVREHGELEAMTYMQKEAERLLLQHDELECVPSSSGE